MQELSLKGKYIVHGPGVDIVVHTNADSSVDLVIASVTKLIRSEFMVPDDTFSGWHTYPDPNLPANFFYGALGDHANLSVQLRQALGPMIGSRVRGLASIMFRKRVPVKYIEQGITEGEYWL